MTQLAELFRAEIAENGPISFERFMDVALYHSEHGYYRRKRDPFGVDGDFFTASQVQPVFGRIMQRVVAGLAEEMGNPAEFTVVELGPGRGEMAKVFSEWNYVSVEVGNAMPERFCGAVFANEYFDALPIDTPGRRVGFEGERFVWVPEGAPWVESRVRDEAVIANIARRLERGFVLAIDYGYTDAEGVRFPEGTLMSYRRHAASSDVLSDPGDRDITAHVDFTGLMTAAEAHGFEVARFERLARLILHTGEADGFAGIIGEEERLRLQLKTLLFGMGETFRALLLRKK